MNLEIQSSASWSRITYIPEAGNSPNERIELTLHQDGRVEYRFYGKYREGMADRYGLAQHHEITKDGLVTF